MKLEKVENMSERETLETPQLNPLVNPSSATIPGDFPSTAELMQKVISVNPFDMKFREANRRLSQGCQNLYDQSALNDGISVPTTGGVTLLKLPSTLSHSPGIFSNINVLSAGIDGENMKTADFSRLIQQIKDSGADSSAVSNTVISTVSTTIPSIERQPVKKRIAIRSNAQGTSTKPVQTNSMGARPGREPNSLRLQSQVRGSDQWDPRDVKPLVVRDKNANGVQTKQQCLQGHAEGSFNQERLRQADEAHGPKSNESPSSAPPRSGRGRGRSSLTADLPPDERRVTILERNKAAAVRYRKRKKEEHDEMISRVQTLEQEKVTLSTQNEVLRRELKRVTEEFKIYRAQCVCHCGRVNDTIPGDSAAEIDTVPPLSQQTDLNTYAPQQMISSGVQSGKKVTK
ncbi:unnamed protein product [Enterobius vermicularis]|uniref:BZIP domain-containing protein n=1 Tax=Enterobius vermicularis TaxID=51028 RepID=A0A0N4UYW0_ENTVE|nr:unnamed protein product [Enterobius vermicularis]